MVPCPPSVLRTSGPNAFPSASWQPRKADSHSAMTAPADDVVEQVVAAAPPRPPLTCAKRKLRANAAAVSSRPLGQARRPPFLPDRADVLPAFALGDDRATYPFVSLAAAGGRRCRRAVARAMRQRGLAARARCARLRRLQAGAHVLFPAVVDVETFGDALAGFVAETRRRSGVVVLAEWLQEQTVYGRDIHWLGLFFAVTASGLQ